MAKDDQTSRELRYIAARAGRSLVDIEDLGRLKDVAPSDVVAVAPLPEVRSLDEIIAAVGADADPAFFDDVIAAHRAVIAAQEFASDGLLRPTDVVELVRARDESLAWAGRSGLAERVLCVRIEATHRAGGEVTWLAFVNGKLDAKRGAARSGRPGMKPIVAISIRAASDEPTRRRLRAAGVRESGGEWSITIEEVRRRNADAARAPSLFD